MWCCLGAVVLQVTLVGPTLKFSLATVIAVTGANVDVTLDGVSVPLWTSVLAPAGATLRVGNTVEGCRAYIAFKGPFTQPLGHTS